MRWYQGDPVGDDYASGEFTGLKRTEAEMVDCGVFSQAEALEYLATTIRDAACPHEEVRITRAK